MIREAYEAYLYGSDGSFAGSIGLDGSENTLYLMLLLILISLVIVIILPIQMILRL